MGLGEAAAGAATAMGYLLLGFFVLIIVVLGLLMRRGSGGWSSTLKLWGGTLVVALVIATLDYVSAEAREQRRAGSLRDEIAAAAGVSLGANGRWVGQRRSDCDIKGPETEGWIASGYGDVADPMVAADAFDAALVQQGLALTGRGLMDRPGGPTRWLLASDGTRSARVDVTPYGRVYVEAEDGCVVLKSRRR